MSDALACLVDSKLMRDILSMADNVEIVRWELATERVRGAEAVDVVVVICGGVSSCSQSAVAECVAETVTAVCGGGCKEEEGACASREVVDMSAEGEGLAGGTLPNQILLNHGMAMAASAWLEAMN